MAIARTKRISILLDEIGNGGVERCLLNLARGFVARGIATDLIVRTIPDNPSCQPAPGVNVVCSGERASRADVVAKVLAETGGPTILLAAKENDIPLMFELRARLGARAILIASLNYTGQLEGRGSGHWRRWMRYRSLRRHFGRADGVFCVSGGVADDMARILGAGAPPLTVVPNPVITPELGRLAEEPLDHPWFGDGQPPVVLGVGRLSLIKNFPLLIRAFARVRRDVDARLVILGDGKQRDSLHQLGARLGLEEAMALPGHVTNPYSYMKQSSVFVLSSLWEGFGNVLVEALACGTPVVATDCRSGPAEILNQGRYGPLVPIGDDTKLAEAVVRTLKSPPARGLLERAIAPYTLDRSVDAYLTALGIGESET